MLSSFWLRRDVTPLRQRVFAWFSLLACDNIWRWAATSRMSVNERTSSNSMFMFANEQRTVARL